MLDENAIGLSLEQKYTYTWRDILLYNLSVGAKSDDVNYVYEKDLKVIPTFGVIPCTCTFGTEPYSAQPLMPTKMIEGIKTEGTLHMDHFLKVHRPIPQEATLQIKKTIRNVYDRGEGKGAKINVEIVGLDENGNEIFTNTMGYLNRWAGGFGGSPIPKSTVEIPEREPDCTLGDSYPLNAPLIYRLTGDTFPLHADPAFAQKSGFSGPIVHGLCSLGYACRLMVDKVLGGDVSRFVSIENQFRSVAMPGDSFILELWNETDGETLFRMKNKADQKAILDYGKMTWKI